MSGYTFTQSLIKLLTLLRDGRHIDAVIFYGGDNDIDYAYNLGEVGALEAENMVRVRLEGTAGERITEFGREQMNGCVLCLAGVVLVRNMPGLRDYVSPYLVRSVTSCTSSEDRAMNTTSTGWPTGSRGSTRSPRLVVEDRRGVPLAASRRLAAAAYDEAGYAPGEAMLARIDAAHRRQAPPALRAHARGRGQAGVGELRRRLARPRSPHDRRLPRCRALCGDANGLVAHAIYDVWKDGR